MVGEGLGIMSLSPWDTRVRLQEAKYKKPEVVCIATNVRQIEFGISTLTFKEIIQSQFASRSGGSQVAIHGYFRLRTLIVV